MSLMYSRFMLFTLYVVCKLVAIDAQNYRKCNPHHLEDCPKLAICTQTEKESNVGECKCGSEYVFNSAHNKNATDYCIHNPNVVPTVGVASSSSSIAGAPAGSKTNSVTSQNEQPGAHHLVGGILIPVMLVIVVIAVAFIVKRLNLVRRARDMFFSRRNRPFYEDVMMSNDNDDPPLI